MAETSMVHVRVDEKVKANATAALEAMGISVSDADDAGARGGGEGSAV